MRKSFKRLLQLVAMLVLIVGSVAPAGWAKQREDESIIKEAVAWIEDGEVRLQIAFAKAPEESELTIVQEDWEQSRTYRKASRLSVALVPESHQSIEVALRSTSSRTDQVSRWEVQLPNTIETKDAGKLRKADWDKKAAQKDSLLEMRKLEEREEDRNPEPKEEAAKFTQLERWEKEFYQKFAPGEKPKEADIRSSRVVFEMEPNDTVKKADWLFDKQDAFGKIGKSGDVDFWKIRATENGVMNVSLRDIPNKQDYHLYVFDVNERELARSELSGEAEEIIEGVGTERREWYYVMVKGAGNSHDPHHSYRLRIDFQSVQGNVKSDEYEPNNTLANAYDMGVEQTLKANLHSLQDVDFYRFSFKRTSTLFVRLAEIPTGMDIDVQLLDEKGKLLGRSEKPRNADEEIVFNANPGTYVIKVMASRTSGFTANSYKLDVKIHTIPVIFIPGIGGSRLEVEENGSISEAWLSLGRAMTEYNDPHHRRVLSLMPVREGSVEVKPRVNGIRIFPERADEGFRAIQYLTYNTKIPTAHETSEQYDSMIKELRKKGYLQFRTIYAMPYDWRYSNAENAKHLKEKIDLALQRTGARQVHLVAHSMGGLLVRETLLSNISYQSKVNRIIYMGTPFLGSPRAYQAIKHGYDFGIPLFDAGTGKTISEYAPAVYELLPSKKYVHASSFLKKNQKANYSYNDLLRDEDLQVTYLPLLNQAIKLHDKWDNKVINVPQYSIIGQGQATLLGYFFDKATKEFVPFYDNNSGDGTVPYESANHSLKDIKKKYYVTGEHAKLPLIPQVIEQVIDLLQGKDEKQSGIRTSAVKNFDYLYYIIKSEDGTFPSVTIQKDGREMTLEPKLKEWWEDLSIEYHDKIIVVHVKDQQPLAFKWSSQQNQENPSRIIVRQFSSEDSKRYREEGREFILGPDGLVEVE
ncbi:alpha/beta fold hydrolase [Brevibacillus invocatus]|uniref:alpha/beta fold hydrolase n=1 Tax=Brevibacillus invocatus TaxID=173959 RepID=UPI0020423067|nr:alpha/beta fold hydrolase [Brevibacillus invocatus]MCM3077568.1 esterase [Brevibacillus invocatus]MCM3429595.1 esterase [Brevibacillus invocatus]